MEPEALLGVLSYAGKLKTIKRTGWIESGVADPESVADHSYRTALAAMLLSDEKGLDTCKVMRMALLHDLAESVIGDITPKAKQENHTELENQAMNDILSMLPDAQRTLYWTTWLEYQEKKTREAILVHDADKIEMVLQASEYQKTQNLPELNRFYHAMVSRESKKIIEKIKRN